MPNLRFKVVQEAFKKAPCEIPGPPMPVSSYFGEEVFSREKMASYLDAETYHAFASCVDSGLPLNRDMADKIASGMKRWAMEKGVTHFSHWFQPLTESTAEKHDSMDAFDGSALVQQEPDASSFPSGGLRATFEARGYTAWDPASPVFIQEDTLCIPSVFIAYTGEALDYKTPLKRAEYAVCNAALAICKLFDPSVKHVFAYLGWEQEYFLVDSDLFSARPDLMLTGRTLMGHASSKSQQLDDHYFGVIPPRIAAFMKEVEIEALKLGIPLRTRHNEVAPNQFELAPLYGELNLSNDQNQIMMNIMRRVARKHGFVVLLHEKPFAGINGSGKHNNWSLGTDTGICLMAPGKDALGNLQFVTFFVNTLVAVKKANALLKASIASATNAHRLGASEAPPAIVSAFIGQAMTEVLKRLKEMPLDTPIHIKGKRGTFIGDVGIPEIFVDNTDRNRTSPFAFTGNRFEFRAVGSSANCAGAMIALNAAVADQLTLFKRQLDKELKMGIPLNVGVMKCLKPLIAEVIDTVCFEGNGYSEEWRDEAIRRGLDVEYSIPKMFDAYISNDSVEMFKRTGVFSYKELQARNEVKWETYSKKVEIEGNVILRMAINHIIPAGIKYQNILLSNRGESEVVRSISKEISIRMDEIADFARKLKTSMQEASLIQSVREKAIAYEDVSRLITEIRNPIDALEELVDNAIWPLPKYREMLFIN